MLDNIKQYTFFQIGVFDLDQDDPLMMLSIVGNMIVNCKSIQQALERYKNGMNSNYKNELPVVVCLFCVGFFHFSLKINACFFRIFCLFSRCSEERKCKTENNKPNTEYTNIPNEWTHAQGIFINLLDLQKRIPFKKKL